MKRIFLVSTAIAALGYMNDTCATTLVTVGKSKTPVRINTIDFDEDQAKPAGERQYKAHTGTDDAVSATGVVSDVNLTGQGEGGTILTTAAPSAPDFSNPAGAAPLMDESKNAAAPTATDAGQWLVMKKGTGKAAKFFVADGMGVQITGDAAKLAGIDESGYDTEDAARAVIDHTSR